MKTRKINAKRDRQIAKKVRELTEILNAISCELSEAYEHYQRAVQDADSVAARNDAYTCALLTEGAMKKYWDVLDEIRRVERALANYNILSEQMQP